MYAQRATAESPVSLIVTGRRANLLDSLCEDLMSYPHCKAAVPLAVDVSDKSAMFSAIENLPDSVKNIDVLVNNAGLALGTSPIHEGSVDDWETMVDVNCKGLLYATKAVLPGMVERGEGHVVNIGR
jgi:NADP-dependent 3-hydroxy acid dehydrogenase YdfG